MRRQSAYQQVFHIVACAGGVLHDPCQHADLLAACLCRQLQPGNLVRPGGRGAVQAYPPLPFDCCDESAAIGDIWEPAPPALGEGRPANVDFSCGIDYYAW